MNNSKELSPKVSIHKVSGHKQRHNKKVPTLESQIIGHNHMYEPRKSANSTRTSSSSACECDLRVSIYKHAK